MPKADTVIGGDAAGWEPGAGRGRRVYPGFMQLSAFVAMNKRRHFKAYAGYWWDALHGAGEERAAHEKFYDDYNAVLDMDAGYYLDTVRVVFQEHELARGVWAIDGAVVRPVYPVVREFIRANERVKGVGNA